MKQLSKYYLLSHLGNFIVLMVLLSPFSFGQTVEEDYTKQVVVEFGKGNWEVGKKIVDKGLKEYPDDSDLKMLLGRYYHEKKLYDKARYQLKKALELNPDNVDAKQILVNVETESKRYSSAICYVNELLEVNPYWKGLWLKKIELYDLQGNHVEANRLRKRISQIYPEDTQLQKDYAYNTELEATSKSKAGKIEEAIQLNQELLQLEPDNVNRYLTLSNNYLKSGSSESALSVVERGLIRFPQNIDLINKKTGILADKNRYGELLPFLQEKMQQSNGAELRRHYNYYLLEAARYSKNQDPVILYGKVFDQNNGNTEAFNYVFSHYITIQQYEEALLILDKHQRVVGESKELSLKKVMIYRRMENNLKANSLVKQLFIQYPDDLKVKQEYVDALMSEAKKKTTEKNYEGAIEDWQQVVKYGSAEEIEIAELSIFNAYMELGNYDNALKLISEMEKRQSTNSLIHLKTAEVFFRKKEYENAERSYQKAIELADSLQKVKYISGYSDMLILIVKDLTENYRPTEALSFVKKWLAIAPNDYQGLVYAVNLSYQLKKYDEALAYTQQGQECHPDALFFQLKRAEFESLSQENYSKVYPTLHNLTLKNPYHKDVVNTFVQLSEDYSGYLLKHQEPEKAIIIIDTALNYRPDNKDLKYLKGIAFEKLNQYDSAYYYQSFYEPSASETSEFKQQLKYLKYKSYRNEVAVYHLRSRFGDNYTINTISSIEYSRFLKKDVLTGRFHYAGRQSGKGIQIQAEWNRNWTPKFRSKVDFAWANLFFPRVATNISVYRDFTVLKGMEFELGVGYRRLYENEDLFNLVVGATKELEDWRLNLRFNNFLLNGKWLYNATVNVRYYLSSPKNYIMATAGIGSSPDIELINYQFYNGFSVLNTMVGVGAGHMITKNVSAGVIGTWYNYSINTNEYRNLYNLFFTINVAF